MKITIDVSDFYLEEEDLETSLKKNITNEVVQQIKLSIKEKVDSEITIAIREKFDNELTEHIQGLVNEITTTTMVKNPDSYNKEKPMVTLSEYMAHKFTQETGYRSADETVKKLAHNLGQEMKNRYDMFFASQFVIKMNEQGLLKEGAMAALLPDTK